jgi:hypothetical protein
MSYWSSVTIQEETWTKLTLLIQYSSFIVLNCNSVLPRSPVRIMSYYWSSVTIQEETWTKLTLFIQYSSFIVLNCNSVLPRSPVRIMSYYWSSVTTGGNLYLFPYSYENQYYRNRAWRHTIIQNVYDIAHRVCHANILSSADAPLRIPLDVTAISGLQQVLCISYYLLVTLVRN